MKNKIDSNFAIAVLMLVAACIGFSFWFLRDATTSAISENGMIAEKETQDHVSKVREKNSVPIDSIAKEPIDVFNAYAQSLLDTKSLEDFQYKKFLSERAQKFYEEKFPQKDGPVVTDLDLSVTINDTPANINEIETPEFEKNKLQQLALSMLQDDVKVIVDTTTINKNEKTATLERIGNDGEWEIGSFVQTVHFVYEDSWKIDHLTTVSENIKSTTFKNL